jgi:hypothetical protein
MTRKTRTKMATPQKQSPPTGRDYIYPDKTTGSEVAAKVRKDGNRWSESKRAQLFETGMQVIYGGTGTKTPVRTGH